MTQLNELVTLLNNNYLNHYNTRIVGGFDEPFYQTFVSGQPAQIQFSRDYIRSALHELAHWCVAGAERRKIDDYGYWYAEDGRTQQQQNEFFKVEVKPQAIEWAFSIVLGIKFEASVDNLGIQVKGVDEFNNNLKTQLHSYSTNGFPKRVKEILGLFSQYSGASDFSLSALQAVLQLD